MDTGVGSAAGHVTDTDLNGSHKPRQQLTGPQRKLSSGCRSVAGSDPRGCRRLAGAQSGFLHVSACVQPSLEAAQIADVAVAHILESLADER